MKVIVTTALLFFLHGTNTDDLCGCSLTSQLRDALVSVNSMSLVKYCVSHSIACSHAAQSVLHAHPFFLGES